MVLTQIIVAVVTSLRENLHASDPAFDDRRLCVFGEFRPVRESSSLTSTENVLQALVRYAFVVPFESLAPHLITPPDETIIWRYMDFARFMQILETKTLWFARADQFEDPLEGTFTDAEREALLQDEAVHALQKSDPSRGPVTTKMVSAGALSGLSGVIRGARSFAATAAKLGRCYPNSDGTDARWEYKPTSRDLLWRNQGREDAYASKAASWLN